MPKIIFTSRYIKPTSKTSKSKLKSFVNYVANRDGVEKINVLSKSVSNKQELTIQKALELYPELKNTFEYEDYIKNKTIENGTELLNKFVDDNILSDGDIKNYVSYVGKRPNVQKINTHGLFSNDFYNIDLQKAIKEMSNHEGNIWTHVISLRREDAHRLNYENAEKWHSLIQTQVPDIAKSMNIPTDDLRWYAGFHNESHHPHVHLIVYSKNTQKGFLNNVGIEKIRSSFATEMFKDDRLQSYKNKDLVRKTLNDMAKEKIEKSLEKINASEHENPLISEMLLQLKDELKNLKGRKVYGNLKGVEKQKAKNLVDNIVIELSKNNEIKSIYDEWLEIKKTIEMDYRDSHFTEIDLVNNKEFLTIKNMIIDEALRLENLKFLDHDEPLDFDSLETFGNPNSDDNKSNIKPKINIEKLEELADEGSDIACYKLGKLYLFDDDYKDKEKGLLYLKKSAENGNEYAEKLLEYLKNNNYSIAPNITKLLYRIGKIISDDTNVKINECNKFVDKKLMKKIAIKKMEQGHKL